MEVTWPERSDDDLRAGVIRVVRAVTALGGAVGWVDPPSDPEIIAWLESVLAGVRADRAHLALCRIAGRPEALGYVERLEGAVLAHNAEIRKVMCHPRARGHGLAKAVVEGLVGRARADRVETLILDVRGNNHAAMALYEQVGFVAYGRLPDFIAVGNERFDRVCYRLDLRPPGAAGPVRHGGSPVGPGRSWRRGDSAENARPPPG